LETPACGNISSKYGYAERPLASAVQVAATYKTVGGMLDFAMAELEPFHLQVDGWDSDDGVLLQTSEDSHPATENGPPTAKRRKLSLSLKRKAKASEAEKKHSVGAIYLSFMA